VSETGMCEITSEMSKSMI